VRKTSYVTLSLLDGSREMNYFYIARAVVVAVWVPVLLSVSDATVVVSPAEFAGRDLVTTVYGFSIGEDVRRVGLTAVPFDTNWCEKGELPEGVSFSSTEVLYVRVEFPACFTRGYAWLARITNESGAAALLYTTYETPGHEAYVWRDRAEWNRQRGFPAFEIKQEDVDFIDELVTDSQTVILDVDADENPWLDFYLKGWLAVQVICTLIILPVLFLGLWRTRWFVVHSTKNQSFRLAIVILSIENVGNILRLLLMSVDPMWSRDLFPYWLGRLLLTITIPIGLVSAVLLFLAWNDILTSMHVRSSIFTRRWSAAQFVFIAGLLFALDLIFTLLAALQGTLGSIYIAGALALCSVITAIAIFYFGQKLLKKLKEFEGMRSSNVEPKIDVPSSGAGSSEVPEGEETQRSGRGLVKTASIIIPRRARKRNRVKRLTYKIQMTALFLILSAIAIVISGQDYFLFNPAQRAIAITLVIFTQTARSYFTISFFEVVQDRAGQKGDSSTGLGSTSHALTASPQL